MWSRSPWGSPTDVPWRRWFLTYKRGRRSWWINVRLFIILITPAFRKGDEKQEQGYKNRWLFITINRITFSDTELAYAANADGGVEDIVNNLKPLVDKWKVSPGDLIYFAGAAGITNCPGAPHIPFFTGRKNPTGPAPDGTVNVPTGKILHKIQLRWVKIGTDWLGNLHLSSFFIVIRFSRRYPQTFQRSWLQPKGGCGSLGITFYRSRRWCTRTYSRAPIR